MTRATRKVVPAFALGLLALLILCACVRGSSANAFGRAPEFVGLQGWLNAPPQSIEGLRGKVVLVQFWSRGCDGCANVLPHVVRWHERYRDRGLAVVGIHTPQTEEVTDVPGLQTAMREQGVHFPVALDNGYATWEAYGNRSWPACYLVNREGLLVGKHVGDRDYARTEATILALLEE